MQKKNGVTLMWNNQFSAHLNKVVDAFKVTWFSLPFGKTVCPDVFVKLLKPVSTNSIVLC